ncbi:MAG: hypothetical protein P4L99_12740 [Chthoniobacter sp.]|nr:hypothetical protein [Chthoniobacter sp.]
MNMLLARLGLGKSLGADAREWAIEQMIAGRDSRNLRMLAGTIDADESGVVADLFGRALRELGIDLPDPNTALVIYAQEFAREYLAGNLPREALLSELCALCIATQYTRPLYPFYLLRWTLDDLTDQGFSFYRKDVTMENFNDVLHTEINALLSTSPNIA